MIKGILKRTYYPTQTVGNLIITKDDKLLFMCYTIELPEKGNAPQISCIPEGDYKVVYRESAKYPQHYQILNVQNRDFILIHQANYVGSVNPKTHKPDLLGCVGVGSGYADLTGDGIVELINSSNTLKKLIAAVGKNEWSLKIESNKAIA